MEEKINLVVTIFTITIAIISVILNVIYKIKNGKKINIVDLVDTVRRTMEDIENTNINGALKKTIVETRIKDILESTKVNVDKQTISDLIEVIIKATNVINIDKKENKKEGANNEVRGVSNIRL
jgi:hypothetical protein